jgi:hypothetical protein
MLPDGLPFLLNNPALCLPATPYHHLIASLIKINKNNFRKGESND